MPGCSAVALLAVVLARDAISGFGAPLTDCSALKKCTSLVVVIGRAYPLSGGSQVIGVLLAGIAAVLIHTLASLLVVLLTREHTPFL